MSTVEAGYQLTQVFAHDLILKRVELIDSLPEEGNLEFAWDWHIENATTFQVALTIQLPALKERPESVRVMIVGEFSMTNGVPVAMPIRNFVSMNAPAILLPYIREAVSSLTGRSRFGPYFLPPLNILKLMAGHDFAATMAAQELAGDPLLAQAYGINQDELTSASKV